MAGPVLGGGVMKIPVICPACEKARIADRDEDVKNIAVPSKDLGNYNWKPDCYIKCWRCKREIALKRVG